MVFKIYLSCFTIYSTVVFIMYKFLKILIGFVSILVLVVTNVCAENRYALVIGNGDYKDAPLKNPANDATDMAKVLETCGFSVSLMKNVTQKEMEQAVRLFGKQLKKGGVGLFYYAGHALQLSGRNYLIPTNSIIESEIDVKYEGVDVGLILGKMEDAGNEINIVLLDACRNNPFARSFRSQIRGLVRIDAPKGSIIAYATSPGSVAADGDGQNGVYTKYLLENIKKPGLTVEQILKNVRIAVVSETLNKQVPWEASTLMGNFYFMKKRATTDQIDSSNKKIRELKADRVKFEKEKKEFEKLKKKLTDSEHVNVVSIKKSPIKNDLRTQHDNYEKLSSGIVYDKTTQLEWFAGPNIETGYRRANSWISKLNIDNGKKWRMPTTSELKTLFIKNAGIRNMTTLLHMTGCLVWSQKTSMFSSSAPCFDFCSGTEMTYDITNAGYFRAFAVRSL